VLPPKKAPLDSRLLGWRDGGFFFNDGYWGPEVGFYGGINYGFGYFGEGYGGGRWMADTSSITVR